MNRASFLYILFAMSFGNLLLAQVNFERGFVIGNDGDTTSGWIHDISPKVNARECHFKMNNQAELKVYNPSQISYYSIDNGKRYESFKVDIGGGETQFFLEYLVDGVIDLLYLRGPGGFDHYFIQKGQELLELKQRETIVYENGKRYKKVVPLFRSTLTYVMSDAPPLESQLTKTKLKHKSLINLLRNYHNTINDSIQYDVYDVNRKNLNDSKWNFRPGISLNGYSTQFNVNTILNSFGTVTTSNGVVIASTVPVYIQSNVAESFSTPTKRVYSINSLSPELHLTIDRGWKTSFRIGVQWYRFDSNDSNFPLQFDALRFPFGIKRSFLNYNKLSPYLLIGGSAQWVMNRDFGNSNLIYSIPAESGNPQEIKNVQFTDESSSDYRSEFGGFIIAVGTDYKLAKRNRISLELRYGELFGLMKFEYEDKAAARFEFRASSIQLNVAFSF